MKRISGRKFLSIISAWSLLINQFLPFASALIVPAYAQEETVKSINFNSSSNSFILPVNNNEATSYLLAYRTADDKTEAVIGKNTQDIFAGTCSENGNCVKHQVVRGILKTQGKQTRFVINKGKAEVVSETDDSSLELSEADNQWLENNPSSPQTTIPLWLTNSDESFTTTDPVSLNAEYMAPFNDKLIIKFTKLPDVPGQITIKEIAASFDLGDNQQVGSVYEITSIMPDGEFTYNLALPVPKGVASDQLTVKYAESLDEISTAKAVDQEVTTSNDSINVIDLNHLTVFVLVNDTDNGGTATTTDDIANGQIATLKDTWIDETAANQDVNHGSEQTFKVQSRNSGRNQRALVNFDLGPISSANTIDKATLRLYMTTAPSNNRTYQIYRLDSADWVEGDGGTNNSPVGEVRWDNQPTSSLGASSGTNTGTIANVWIEFDVTGDVAAFLSGTANYGWLIRDASESESGTARTGTFRSRQSGTQNQRPQLVVDFTTSSDEPTDFKSPTDELFTTGGDGNGFETSPTSALADGGGAASNINGAGDRHLFYNYGFSIPDGSTINGIEVRSDWYLDSTSGVNSLSVELSSDGGASWTSAKTDSTETQDEHIVSFGGYSDQWGRTWSVDAFSNSNFRVRATSNSDNANRDFFLDWIPVRVYYTPDTIDPTTPGTPTTDTPTNNQTPTWTWDPSSDANLDYYLFFWDTILGGESYSSSSLSSATISYQILTPLLEGMWYGKVRAFDTASNFATSDNGSALVDTTAPVSSATAGSYTYGNWSSSDVTITFGCTDSGSGCETTPVPYSNQYPYHCIDTADTCTPNTPTHDLGISGNGTWYVRYFSRDVAGNSETVQTVQVNIDKTFPSIFFDAPTDGSLLRSTVLLQASGSDEGGSGLNPLKFSYRKSADSDFTDIGIDSEDPYELSWDTTPLTDGDYVLRVAASDGAGNIFWPSDVNVTIDNTVPTTPTADPEAGDYTSDQSVTLDSSDTGSGLDKIYYTVNGDIPNSSSPEYSSAITVDHDLTLKAIAYDHAGNASGILSASYHILPPVISAETSGSITTGGLTVTWTTDHLATSRVIFDTVSHPVLGVAPNYDYAGSTVETDTAPKVTSHTVTLTGLGSATTYYYRTVSHGSPETVGPESSFVTKALDATTTTSDGGTTGGGTTDGTTAAASPSPVPAAVFVAGVLGETTTTASEEPSATGPVTPSPTANPESVLGAEKNKTSTFIWLILPLIGLIYVSYRLSKQYLHR